MVVSKLALEKGKSVRSEQKQTLLSSMLSEQALRYQANKCNLALDVQRTTDLLDQKINIPRLLEIASKAVGCKCISAEAVAAGKIASLRVISSLLAILLSKEDFTRYEFLPQMPENVTLTTIDSRSTF
jgi:hypothetical protein